MIKGITVTLYAKTDSGEVDAFGKTIYTETPIEVENVLVEPMTTDDIITNQNLYGKKATYRLCIPKGDANEWADCRVDFMGERWQVFGFIEEWIGANVPLKWNKKVMVKRYE